MFYDQGRNLGKLGGVSLVAQITNRIRSLSKCAYTDSSSGEGSSRPSSQCRVNRTRVIRRLLRGLNRELAAHFGRVLVGIEPGKEMQDPIWQFHDGFNPGSL